MFSYMLPDVIMFSGTSCYTVVNVPNNNYTSQNDIKFSVNYVFPQTIILNLCCNH